MLGPGAGERLFFFDGGDDEPAALRLDPSLPQGPAIVCTGGGDHGVSCRDAFLYRGDTLRGPPPAAELELEVTFEPGLEVGGRYVMDGLPLAGAKVGVVPAAVEAYPRPFVLPLERDGAGLARRISSGADGRFLLPPLAAGRYLLETVLPTGRLHRSEPFDLPAAADARLEAGPVTGGERVVWELGELEVEDRLAVAVRVVDQDGRGIAGAAVTARQGSSGRTLDRYRATTDAEGRARLSGFDAERPMDLECVAAGHRPVSLDFELLPVEVVCQLDALARITGRALNVAGEPAAGAVASLRGGETPDGAWSVAVDEGGVFVLEPTPGPLTLIVVAPGLQAARRELELAPGGAQDLGEIVLAPGRALEGRVVAADERRGFPVPGEPSEPLHPPIAGAEILALEPPGAARAVSDADGAFTLHAIGDAALTFEVAAEGFAARRLTLEPPAQRRDEPLVVELRRGGWIRACSPPTPPARPSRPPCCPAGTGSRGRASRTWAPPCSRCRRPRAGGCGWWRGRSRPWSSTPRPSADACVSIPGRRPVGG